MLISSSFQEVCLQKTRTAPGKSDQELPRSKLHSLRRDHRWPALLAQISGRNDMLHSERRSIWIGNVDTKDNGKEES